MNERNPQGRTTKVRHAAAVVYLCLLAAFGGSRYLVLRLICRPLSIPPSGDIHTQKKKSNREGENVTQRHAKKKANFLSLHLCGTTAAAVPSKAGID